MRILVVEDEVLAAERLCAMIRSIEEKCQIVEVLDTVAGVKKWLDEHDHPDLMFLDIQLADGLSFEVFEDRVIDIPVIFTTAYDQFAIKAFKLNSIDYLLKPIDQEELSVAIYKFKRNRANHDAPSINATEIIKLINNPSKKHKERFVIKVGEHLKTVQTIDAKVFYSQDKATYLHNREDHKYILDYTLDQLETIIDSERFFRINRK